MITFNSRTHNGAIHSPELQMIIAATPSPEVPTLIVESKARCPHISQIIALKRAYYILQKGCSLITAFWASCCHPPPHNASSSSTLAAAAAVAAWWVGPVSFQPAGLSQHQWRTLSLHLPGFAVAGAVDCSIGGRRGNGDICRVHAPTDQPTPGHTHWPRWSAKEIHAVELPGKNKTKKHEHIFQWQNNMTMLIMTK